MIQSRKDSILEAITNILIGSGIAFLSQIIWFPLIGKEFTIMDNVMTTAFFTVVSFARSYWVRRLFNGKSVYFTLKAKVKEVLWLLTKKFQKQ